MVDGDVSGVAVARAGRGIDGKVHRPSTRTAAFAPSNSVRRRTEDVQVAVLADDVRSRAQGGLVSPLVYESTMMRDWVSDRQVKREAKIGVPAGAAPRASLALGASEHGHDTSAP
jgi:hypothetical protein